MKLYVPNCHICSTKIPLDISANTRNDLRAHFGGNDFYCTCGTCHQKSTYDVAEVRAEMDSNSLPAGAAVGGVVGLLGGPLGAIIGAIIGGAIGGQTIRRMQQR